MVRVQDPRAIEREVVAELRNWQGALRTARGGLGIRRVGRGWAVRRDLGQHSRPRLKVIFRVEQVFVSRIWTEPHVIVAVVLVRDAYRNTLGVLARVEHGEAVRIVNAGLGWAEPAAAGQLRWRRLSDPRALRAAAKQDDGDRRQRRKTGTQPKRESASGPEPETITCALTSTAR